AFDADFSPETNPVYDGDAGPFPSHDRLSGDRDPARLLCVPPLMDALTLSRVIYMMGRQSNLSRMHHDQTVRFQQMLQHSETVQRQLIDRSDRDALTGLPGREHLMQQLQSVLNGQKRRVHEVGVARHDALAFLDLDNFKLINDSLGHEVGDQLLVHVAQRLNTCIRDTDCMTRADGGEAVRLGGDEFVVLLRDLRDHSDAVNVARRIVDLVAQPFEIAGRNVVVGCSVGLAFASPRLCSAGEWLRNADTAMYRAKQSGTGQVMVFDTHMHQAVCRRLDIESELRTALQRKQFQLRYQPIIELNTNRVIAAESLLRWTNSAGEAISPMEFIPIAEEIGMIGPIGKWVTQKTLTDLAELLNEHPGSQTMRDMQMSINVSRLQLCDDDFAAYLTDSVQRLQLAHRRLALEVTESRGRGQERAMETLRSIEAAGFDIHLDDFGNGQAALGSFRRYPIATVKMDRSFVENIVESHDHQAIAQAVIQLAHRLNANVVAEGVERREQAELLRHWGCDKAQGFLFAPPLPKEAFSQMLRESPEWMLPD
ncbi:MAG: EAL domain-containing protein, partial [Planctomycetota bacterium]